MTTFSEVQEAADELVKQICASLTGRKVGDAFKIHLSEQHEVEFYYNSEVFVLPLADMKRRPRFNHVKNKVIVGDYVIISGHDPEINKMLRRLNDGT